MEKKKSREKNITWRAPEFLFRRKTLIWYTNVSLFFLIALVALLFANVWAGAAITALLFWIFIVKANDKPRTIDYTITATEIKIDTHTLLYSQIRSFTVDTTHISPVITLNLENSFAVPITLVVKKDILDEVVEHLAFHLPMDQTFSFLRWLTHRLHY